jgi:hypothetical protein
VVEGMLLKENEDLLEKASYSDEIEWSVRILDEDIWC